MTSDWKSAFNSEIRIKNISEVIIEDWKLEFDFDHKIDRFWTAEILKQEGNHYYIKNAGYNANIKPGETVVLGFNGNPGNVVTKPQNYELCQIVQDFDPTKNTDSDGLSNSIEKILGTNPRKTNSDSDKLSDGYEYYILGTDPKCGDTDNNGINDGLEDFDNDKLINEDEYRFNTDPYQLDTDNDKLTDYEEIYTYFTDPLNPDTDDDKINDGDEIILGLNPLSKYTTDGLLDSEVCFKQTISESVLKNINNNNPYSISIEMNAAGLADTTLIAGVSKNSQLLKNNGAILGELISLDYGDLKVEEAEIKFSIDSSYVNKDNRNFPGEQGLDGVQRYQIFCYDTNKGGLYPVDTEYDMQYNSISFTTKELGDYCIMDMDAWMYEMGMMLDDQSQFQIQNTLVESKMQTEVQSSEKDNENQELPIEKCDVLPENYDEIMLEQIYKACGLKMEQSFSSIEMSTLAAPTSSVQRPIDLVFAIDTSGSMSGKIEQCKRYMSTLVSNLYDAGIVANVAVISFCDYQYSNIIYEVTTNQYWAKNPKEASVVINQVQISNYGYAENHIDALEDVMSKLTYRNNTTKFAILLSDEPLYENNNVSQSGVKGIAQKLQNKDFITSVVCYNSEAYTYEPIYTMTNGIQTSITGNFLLQLEVFIKTVMKNNGNYFCAVTPMDLSVIQLSKAPIKSDMVTNDDTDTLANSEEIDWTLIDTTNTTIELPTLKEYWDSLTDSEYSCFGRFTESRQEIINSFVVLPTTSNPLKDDTDKDGYLDHEDPRRIYKDVLTARLNHSYDYIPVEYDGPESYNKNVLYYGGNQSWFYDKNINNKFDDEIIENGGCGALASTDLIMYLTLLREETKKNMPFNFQTDSRFSIPFITYSDYTDVVGNLVNDYRKPMTYDLLVARGTLGYLATDVKYLIYNYLKDNGINMNIETARIAPLAKNDILINILFQIDNEIPVPIMTGETQKYMREFDPDTGKIVLEEGHPIKMYQIDPHTGDPVFYKGDPYVTDFEFHWVNVVGVIIDEIKGTTTLEVASWGEKYLIDFDDYVEGSAFLSSVVWIE